MLEGMAGHSSLVLYIQRRHPILSLPQTQPCQASFLKADGLLAVQQNERKGEKMGKK
jgi:hypothetical protein